MKKMNKEDKKILEGIVTADLISAVTKDYAKEIMSHIDDVRFAIGRELVARLGK